MRPLYFLALSAALFLPPPAAAWWENGHRTVARIAAANLTPAAQTRLAKLLGVPDTADDVANALAAASTWPDEIKKDRPETASWHYIDLALQDKKDAIPDRCTDNNCVTARIRQFRAQLSSPKTATNPSPISDLDALRFLVHFLGDVEQPLHAVSDDDQGGNCEPLDPTLGTAKNLHAYWDGYLPDTLNPDDKALAEELNKDIAAFTPRRRDTMAQGTEDDWAWESHEIAVSAVYNRLKIPIEPIEFPAKCANAPEAITTDRLAIPQTYTDAMLPVVRLQLERGGLRLARILNESM